MLFDISGKSQIVVCECGCETFFQTFIFLQKKNLFVQYNVFLEQPKKDYTYFGDVKKLG